MSQRHIHYEAAFEEYLRSIGRPYIAVDEAKKAIFSGARLKSFDFLVYAPGDTNWLADIKGRKLSLNSRSGRGHLENWATLEDIDGLGQWSRVFGNGFAGLLIFSYWLTEPKFGPPFDAQLHEYRGRTYALGAVTVEWYRTHMRPRSRRWGTVCVPAKAFRQALRPLADFL